MKTAIYPGTFDPITYGHLDIIERASKLFDQVIVAVGLNPRKSTLFSVEERLQMIEAVASHLPNISCDSFDGLLVDFARRSKASIMIRGLRAISDFEYEFQMALVNRKLQESMVTIFLMPGEKYTYLNSSIVKEVARYGGDISAFVPAEISEAIFKKMKLSS